jgi:hypothetical protein
VNAQVEEENRSNLSRITCGWKKQHLPLDWVRRYWRDVHSPAISRRAGLYEYRHSQFGAVRADLFAPIAGIDFSCPAAEQLMWLSDVRYCDEAGLAAFGESPPAEVKAHLLADIDLLVDKSTTYRSVADDACTFIDETGDAAPAGPAASPSFALFFRQRGDDAGFRATLHGLAQRWARTEGVRRVRLSLFERPDMEAERKAGYPIKTHPVEQQYQAWVDLVLDTHLTGTNLLAADAARLAAHVHALHAYPVDNLYTFVVGGKPTLIALRGYPAHEAIQQFNAVGQRERSLLQWMYGPIAS